MADLEGNWWKIVTVNANFYFAMGSFRKFSDWLW
jgi:hypothetical protein